jgi:nucleoid DNA-binding protein
MAKLIQAVRQYGPRVKRNNTVQLEQLAGWIAMRTSLNKSEVTMTLTELFEAVLFFNCQGTPVKMPGLGIFSPSIDRNGKFRINVRTDQALVNGINNPQAFTGTVDNRGNIGLDNAELKFKWDTDHPNDLLEL